MAQRGGAAVSAHLRLTVRTSTSPQEAMAPVSNTTSRQRPPAGQRANPTPKAQPRRYSDSDQARIMGKDEDLTAPTASPAPPECPIARTMRKRRARARQRVTPKQVDAPNVQPHRSNSGAAALPNAPPLPPAAPDMGAQSGRAARQRVGRGADTVKTPPYARPRDRTPPERRTGTSSSSTCGRTRSGKPIRHSRSPSTVEANRPDSEHADIPSGRRSTSQRQPPPLTLPPPRQAMPRIQRTPRPRRPAAVKRGETPPTDKGPSSPVHRLPSGHRQTVGLPTCKKAGTTGTQRHRVDHKKLETSEGGATGSLGSAPTYKADTPVDTPPPTRNHQQQRPLGRGPPTLIAAASVTVDQDKQLVTAIRRILQARTQVLTTEPPL
ncbi:hypothetical protein WOLCODRAFT_147245 [Wolfiporia cocos MD-104 SS10]|uniref:Uncharacterized protein n=1 Tax=Wolfiporia cocos (strain MD-104) TaxID=742152 RepID=A0A2H3J034_WOLCO|nr:hypothetical protein WOLCODRAFT_147245 [Wolfiporia cocos MD-104 SS10]